MQKNSDENSTQKIDTKPAKQENAFINLLFNIIIPVVVLNRGTPFLGAFNALVLALSAPLIYGSYDLWKKKKVNYFSLLGLLNVGITGSLALLHLEGVWFWVKEAIFPFLLGVFVFASRWTSRPFIQTLILNPQVMNLNLVETRVAENGQSESFTHLLGVSTLWLSSSFFLSSALNFWLATKIFLPLDPTLDAEAKSAALNQQIAHMTQWSFAVIFIPSLVILLSLVYFVLHRIRKLTGLSFDEILPNQ